MKAEVREGLYLFIFSGVAALVLAFILSLTVEEYKGDLFILFANLVFSFGFFHLIAWSLTKFKDDSSRSKDNRFFEKDIEKKKEISENNRIKRSKFIYAFLFNMGLYSLLYILSVII